jgi:predicted alpha/beta-fold hydrolase
MPITESSYQTPFFLRNTHALTVLPTIFRSIKDVHYTRHRMFTSDNGFIDLDWSSIGSSNVAIILHGLEGHTKRTYMRGMVRACNRAE